MTTTVHSPGPCPLLRCLEAGPHNHPVCPDCGAVDHGNAFCVTCVGTWTWMSDEHRAAQIAAIEGRA